MGRVQGQDTGFRIPHGTVLIDEASIGNNAANDRVCVSGIPRASLMVKTDSVHRCTYNPATETPRPVAYKRQNFWTHCALVNVANADTGGTLSVVDPSRSSVRTVLRFSSDMACDIETDVGMDASVERCCPKDWMLSIARRKSVHIAAQGVPVDR
jgi:hypothetical protein